MNAQTGANDSLARLHRAYLRIRREPELTRRRLLVHQIILHPLLRRNLRRVLRQRRRWPKCSQSRRDILQETSCILIEWLTDNDAPYGDQGADKFGGWFSILCRRACYRALSKDKRQRRRLIAIDDACLAEFAVPQNLTRAREQLLAAIERIEDVQVRAALFDNVLGYSARASAERLGLSEASVCRLRARGRRELRDADIDFP